jgi:hypothetical protein
MGHDLALTIARPTQVHHDVDAHLCQDAKSSLGRLTAAIQVVVASPKFGRLLRIDLVSLECWAGEDEVVQYPNDPRFDTSKTRGGVNTRTDKNLQPATVAP